MIIFHISFFPKETKFCRRSCHFFFFQTFLLISSQNSPTPSEGLRDGFDDLLECRLIILTFCHLIIVSEGGYLISLAKKTMERPFLGKRRDMAPHTHFTENGEICRVTPFDNSFFFKLLILAFVNCTSHFFKF